MKPETVLVTRTEPGASKTAAAAAGRGFEPVVSPLARVEYSEEPLDLAGIDAIAVTSRHGVRALSASASARTIPVFAVGGATADAARRNGFTDVHSAGGGAEELARLIAAHLKAGASVLHARGALTAGDLAGDLGARGFKVIRPVLYHTLATEDLRQAALDAFEAPPGPILLAHSPAGAERLVVALDRAGIDAATLRAAAISGAAAEPLRARGIGRIEIAARPDDAGVLDAAERLRQTGTER